MQSFKQPSSNNVLYSHHSFIYFSALFLYCWKTEETKLPETKHVSRILESLNIPLPLFPHDDAVVLSSSCIFSLKSNSVAVVPNSLQYGSVNMNPECLDIASTTGTGSGYVDTGQQFMYQRKGTTTTLSASSLGNGHFENWGDSAMADNSQQTDTSTDVEHFGDYMLQKNGLIH